MPPIDSHIATKAASPASTRRRTNSPPPRSSVERVEELAPSNRPEPVHGPPTGRAPERWRPAASRSGRRRAGRPPACTSGPSPRGRSRGGPAPRNRSRGARQPRRRGRPRSPGRRRCGRRRRDPPPSDWRPSRGPGRPSRCSMSPRTRRSPAPHRAAGAPRGDGGQRGVGLRPVWVGRHGHRALDEDQPLVPVGVDPDGFGRAVEAGGAEVGEEAVDGGRVRVRGAEHVPAGAEYRLRRWRCPRPAPPRPRPPVWPGSGSPRRSAR